MDDSLEAPGKSIVYIAALIGGQYDQPVLAFNALQEVRDFLVGVLIMGIADVGALAEEGIGFVKKQNPVFMLGFIEEF